MLPAACMSALLCPILVWPLVSPSGIAAIDLLKLFLFGTMQFGLGLILLTIGGQMISATENALINTLEMPGGSMDLGVLRGGADNHELRRGHHRDGSSRGARLAQQSI